MVLIPSGVRWPMPSTYTQHRIPRVVRIRSYVYADASDPLHTEESPGSTRKAIRRERTPTPTEPLWPTGQTHPPLRELHTWATASPIRRPDQGNGPGHHPFRHASREIFTIDTATTGARQNASNTDRTRYMWVITVQWPTGGGFGNATLANTVDLPAGASRMDIYTQIRELAERETRSNSLNVLFFSLEPDRLNG